MTTATYTVEFRDIRGNLLSASTHDLNRAAARAARQHIEFATKQNFTATATVTDPNGTVICNLTSAYRHAIHGF